MAPSAEPVTAAVTERAAPLDVGRLLPLYLAQALATGSTNVSTVLASVIMSGLGRESLTGLPATVISLSAALSAGLFGALMLRRGRRLGLSAAFSLGVVGAVVGFLGARAGSVPAFLLGAGLFGAAQGGYQQARYAAAESVPQDRRGAALGVLMLMSVLGSVAMTATSHQIEWLAGRVGATPEVTGWLVAAALMLTAALLMRAWTPLRAPQAATQDRLSLRAAFAMPGVRSTALAMATGQGLMVTLMSLTPLRAHHAGVDHAGVAALITVHVAGMFAFGWLTGPLIDRLGVRFGYVSGALLLVAAALTAPLSGSWLGFSMFLLGLGWNLVNIAGSRAMTRFPAAQGVTDALGYAASAFGTLAGGLTIAHAGFPTLAYACAALGFLPLFSAWRAGRPRPAAHSA
ncbi:MFS transporter [Deinococcus enclensis]|uniref:MFS family permease n=1 Tax=Deinococcus enclensis TaxID=1049582 RepID=A0ABT9M953_9DEIO|nr:MFS transporter [Deinococcus enclensis]MDP9763115.1 MFS family permease [Deinococcus enclensis]